MIFKYTVEVKVNVDPVELAQKLDVALGDMLCDELDDGDDPVL